MCLKNENIKKQNETLKALNGSEIDFFFKNQFDFNFQLVLELNPKFGFIFFNHRFWGTIPTQFQ
jgi:hypothetical protein